MDDEMSCAPKFNHVLLKFPSCASTSSETLGETPTSTQDRDHFPAQCESDSRVSLSFSDMDEFLHIRSSPIIAELENSKLEDYHRIKLLAHGSGCNLYKARLWDGKQDVRCERKVILKALQMKCSTSPVYLKEIDQEIALLATLK
jgi:hypothetical protein